MDDMVSEVEGALEALCDGARSYAFRALESRLLRLPSRDAV